jgi:enolase
VHLAGGAVGRAIAPAGASTGSGEALDLRDGGRQFGGLDVTQAIANVQVPIATALNGLDAADQAGVDAALIALDGTPQKSHLGGNAMIATSMAVAHAAAAAVQQPLWEYLGGNGPMPLPQIQIFGGGAHANRRIDIQDLMVIPVGAKEYSEALDWTARVYAAAGRLMADAGNLAGVADEGGFWPNFASNVVAVETLVRAIEAAGLIPSADVAIAIDVAASTFGKGGIYHLGLERTRIDSDALSEMLLRWLERYPIVSIEDPMGEDDGTAFERFTKAAGPKVQVVGDDLLVTNASRISAAASRSACNAVLIKPNQAGTLTETKLALDATRRGGCAPIVSARSGESEDTTIVHLVVGWGVPQLKVGAFARSERMAKWNEGLRVAEIVGGRLPPKDTFAWGR